MTPRRKRGEGPRGQPPTLTRYDYSSEVRWAHAQRPLCSSARTPNTAGMMRCATGADACTLRTVICKPPARARLAWTSRVTPVPLRLRAVGCRTGLLRWRFLDQGCQITLLALILTQDLPQVLYSSLPLPRTAASLVRQFTRSCRHRLPSCSGRRRSKSGYLWWS